MATYVAASMPPDERAPVVDEWTHGRPPPEDFLAANGMTGLWLSVTQGRGMDPAEAPDRERAMRDITRSGAARYLAQSAAVQEMGAAFDATGIEYALMKGVAWRDDIYPEPQFRVAADIDVLIPRTQLDATRESLRRLGFERAPLDSAHEEAWVRGSVDVDLHWDLLAPGRVPPAVTALMLSRRVRNTRGAWRLCDEDMIAVLLMHTAISKYVCSRHSALTRVVDLLQATNSRVIDWTVVADTVDAAGLRGAAWAMLSWIDSLTEHARYAGYRACPSEFGQRVAPSRARAAYLAAWVRNDWPGRLEPRFPLLVQLLFTLPMHDSLMGSIRAIRGRLSRRHS